ncbi:MAG: ATPase [Candidatus Nomurabacteria bacterium GW2011_GWF2_35_12]|uniref:ATPase n=3 Tax=Candidatus Nomuraibacteriota TaxID=1752729 RepID=A0A0G0GFE8_9BACT|nr:MAG: ATPase [Candidatus Nomurabacteria bacterium GW2011_GWF2_35_12]KKP73037.1 MAG: ATPase [Candidatus Nomurabacteria bacterium GW2011_GWB1_35_20]KKP76370.1 MAG: ATPase, P-type (Transporting), HAD superfamily, subfamily IC [Parcubacteria group bacterium GW2011_GWC1_35_21]KKP98560.1 MAG: ATPase [Candidatus Nomurabacteria bacterium GW2011_GWA1_36_15]HCY17908.1 ATPase [Candidatus Nomurabacteria bacterium]
METKWYLLSQEQIFEKLHTSLHGLTPSDVQDKIKQYGFNILPEKKPTSLIRLFFNQFNSPLILILLLASVITYIIGGTTDAYIILAVLIFNAIVGTIQEGKAQNTLNALKKFVETKATVLRDGTEFIIPDREIVPGDIINLEEGEKVSADARVILSQNLKADEASLTGESEPVYKIAEILKQESSVADQRNMLFKGTHIVYGNGRAVVVGTGSSTVIGKIAKEISSIDTEIPLKTNIRYLSRAIIITVGIICVVLFSIGIATGESIRTMFTVIVSLSVSIIPEGLPIVITLVLATGVWRMSKRNALVKKLQAVEALGQAQIIAVDKTGTITKNELVVRQVWTTDKLFDVGGVGYEPVGNVMLENNVIDAVNHPELLRVGKVVALCVSARLLFSDTGKRWSIAGDPTEAAMVVFSRKIGFNKEDLLVESPIVQEMPFDYKLKYRAVINSVENKNFLTVIGAPEIIIGLSKNIIGVEDTRFISEEDRKKLEEVLINMSLLGQRVVAIGIQENAKNITDSQSISNLTFVGFLGMKDVLRPEVKDAMDRAQEAGIRVVMITGDHKITAMAIAREADIYHDGDEILTGSEIDAMNYYELSDKLSRTTVFARVTPEHKLEIIKAFKKRGEIIAMTGDGVNDAPSLVAADIGVAMGNIGTEVAKEAADIVLLDDNFGSIVSAVEEGRSIYKTIKKVILYLFSTSIGEVLTITGALIFGMPLPILAAQIIWLNFVTDGFLDMSLAMEPKEKGLLLGKFERPKKYLIDKLMLQRMIFMAVPMMIGTLFLFQKYIDINMEKAWTISLTTLAVFQWFNAWNCRSDSKSIFQLNPFSNKFLLGATFIVILLQLSAVYTPFLQKILHTVPLELFDWFIIVPVALSIVFIEETRKLFYRRKLIQIFMK